MENIKKQMMSGFEEYEQSLSRTKDASNARAQSQTNSQSQLKRELSAKPITRSGGVRDISSKPKIQLFRKTIEEMRALNRINAEEKEIIRNLQNNTQYESELAQEESQTTTEINSVEHRDKSDQVLGSNPTTRNGGVRDISSKPKIQLFSKTRAEMQALKKMKAEVQAEKEALRRGNAERKAEQDALKSSQKAKEKEELQAKKEFEKTFKAVEKGVARAIAKEEKEIKKQRRKEEKEEKRKIKIAKTLGTEERLTEPKKRILLKRILLRTQYDKGFFDDIEEEYQDGGFTKEELEASRTARKRSDRRLYKEVQEYEDVVSDVKVKRGWMIFKVGLASALLTATVLTANQVVQDIQDMHNRMEEANRVVTIETAEQHEIESAKSTLDAIIDSTGYTFDNLSEDELIDGVLRISSEEDDITVKRCESALMRFKDQELLEQIVIDAYGEEKFATFSQEEIEEAKKLAYELLSDDKQECLRDPQVLVEIAERKAQEAAERELNNREVQERLNGTEQSVEDTEEERE